MTLTHVIIPINLYQLEINSLLELSILALALSFGEAGLLLSNEKIAEIFNSDRTSVIRAINRLMGKKYLLRVGNKQHRKLVADSYTLPLGSYTLPPEVVALQALTSGASATHNLNNIRKKTRKSAHFHKPTLAELKKYSEEIEYASFDAEKFLDYYESNGWLVGKNRMKNWRATLRNWKRRDEDKAPADPMAGLTHNATEEEIARLNL